MTTLITKARKGLAGALAKASRIVYDTQFTEEIIFTEGDDEIVIFEIVGDNYGAGLTGSTSSPDDLKRLGLFVNVFDDEECVTVSYQEVQCTTQPRPQEKEE